MPEQKEVKKGLRRRDKEVLSCEMCHARVKRLQMGKHLLSHYHCRVAGVNPCSPNARRFLLDNIANVVRQCPFQCAPCRFYCNTEETFLLHWRSDLHIKTLERVSYRSPIVASVKNLYIYFCFFRDHAHNLDTLNVFFTTTTKYKIKE